MIPENFWLFAITALLLNVTPGNDMLFVIARSSSQGSRAGIISSLGIMAGCLVHMTAACCGTFCHHRKIGARIQYYQIYRRWISCFSGVIKSFLNNNNAIKINASVQTISNKKIFWQAVLTNVAQSKSRLVLPCIFCQQFINASSGSTTAQILFLGVWFSIGGTLVNIIVALLIWEDWKVARGIA